jgi:hypothetical protein
MATERQIAANRQNAKSSTGPRTAYGKRRSRRNALRHGLTAETVIDALEDAAAYKALQRAIFSDYCPRSNFEIQIVGRLVSLLWRLRRATSIESGILSLQAETLRKEKIESTNKIDRKTLKLFYDLVPTLAPSLQFEIASQNSEYAASCDSSRLDIARSFTRVCHHDDRAIERIGRYETMLWRQTMQTILLLNSLNRANETDFAFGHSLGIERRRRIRWPPFDRSK